MTQTLAIGPYNDNDRQALQQEFGALMLGGIAEVAGLEPAMRAGISAVAYMGHTAFGGAEMDLLPGLGVIANFGVGYDAIDVAAATARGITVTNTPGVLNDDVADLAVTMLLMQCRRMEQGGAWVREGHWETANFPLNRKASGGVAGVVGLGRIGREIADRLAAFKMDIHYFARSEKDTPGWTYHADPVSLAKAVDFLVVALVGGPETEKFISREVIEALGPRGVVVNISRGSTIDETALLDALERGRIAGAALDVFLNEPTIDPRFLALSNVVLQPHQGSGTVETRAAMGALQRGNIAAHLAGKPVLTPVNKP
ncbi:2-hydroxyacid dehydrogenase [Ruegeria pomeroyi]|uniref:D-isomer specific 2-hydroxyacid dehydrogenase family protein n=2 Tax=Ruegeria pomeroyi TaxID=89184 RepID=Q5LQR6_RUEPO|nr:2-hydroxyacid dehydrogenase [Ruegeria pomeroyi]HCE71047.1 2-hydroxyacid dehydrogenase [Ruegeria sp.]AAV95677.1 D-isomer specific 2-hydroxyacid dehydrogenase family protein [Ruegeria pomeroyi DSS-3]NVK99002.1 2-hydroxyacid dehydrogenase [Ruegeria pomeroyi]NVL03044.1 2-hydroxyacid dehydrogenase [Ruegeria pomeroyi]QWV09262.1 2-hydroxyacid dehydrogenase [Ruegeria pomeroyi]